MRKSTYKNLTKNSLNKWGQGKRREWDKNAAFWIKIIRKELDPYRLKITSKAALESFKNKRKLKILDAGCGEGYLSRILAKQGNRVWGVDFCPELIKAAKELEKEKPLGIKYLLKDFRKTNLPNRFFDAVVAHQTVNEVENPEKAFKEFYRLLKKGGRMILLFLHPCFEIGPEDYFKKKKVEKPCYLVSGIKSPSPYFYLHLPLSQWISSIIGSGFSIKRIGEPHPPLKLLSKNKWWKDNFKKPLFILIEALKS